MATSRAQILDHPVNATLQLVALLKQRIKHGQLLPGQRLIEADIVRETGAGRARVREALKRMEAEGYVTIEEFRGASVRKLGRDEVEQVNRAREALESLAARLLAERGLAAEERRELKGIQAALDAAAKARQFETYMRANDRFHSFIIAGARNRFVASFVERLRIPIFPLQFRSLFNAPGFFAANADHRKITAALLKGDAPAAERAMRAHLVRGKRDVNVLDDSFFA